jgi:hypothetical protein
VTVDYNSVLFEHDPHYHGQQDVAFWWGEAGGEGAMNALRRAGLQLLRYPGGVPANWWDWSQDETGWLNITVEELADYVAGIGAKPLISTNPYRSEVGDGGQRNDPSGSHWAQGVTYFRSLGMNPLIEVGNEPEIEEWSMDDYYNAFNDQATAIKGAHPDVVVMGASSTNAWFWMADGKLQQFVDRCGQNADAISLHWYLEQGGIQGWNLVRDVAQTVWPSYMSFIRRITDKPVYITEWTCLGPTFGDIGDHFNRTIGLALADCDVMMTFARVGMAGHANFCVHQVAGNWGILCSQGDYRPFESPSPRYFVFPLVCSMGNIVLHSSTTSNEATEVAAYAHKRPNGNPTILLINKTSSSRSETIQFNGYDPAGVEISISELRASSSDPDDYDIYFNDAYNPQPAQNDLSEPSKETCSGSSLTRSLPAYSITVLDFLGSTAVMGERAARGRMSDAVKVRCIHGAVRTLVVTAPPSLSLRSVRLYDERGRMVLSSGVWGPTCSRAVNCGALPAGAYMLEARTDEGCVRKSVALP